MAFNQEPIKATTLLEFSNGDKIELQGYVPKFSLNIENNLTCDIHADRYRTANFTMEMDLSSKDLSRMKYILSPRLKWYKRFYAQVARLFRR